LFGFGRGPAVRLRAQQIGITLSAIKQLIQGKSFEDRCANLASNGFIGEVHPPSPHDRSGRCGFSFVEASPSLRDFRYLLFSTSWPVLLSAEGDGDFFGASAAMLSEDSHISVFASRPVSFPLGRDAKALVKELGRLPGFSDISGYMP